MQNVITTFRGIFSRSKKKVLFTHIKTLGMLLFLLIIVEKFTYFTPASSHQAAKAWQPGSHLDVDLTTEVGLK